MAMEELELTDARLRRFWNLPRRWRMSTVILKTGDRLYGCDPGQH